MKRQESDVERRLRAHIYRMARKSAYLPRALQIGHPSISNKQSLGAGANAMVTKAIMNGRDVVIKEIACGDRATLKKCLEVWTFRTDSFLCGLRSGLLDVRQRGYPVENLTTREYRSIPGGRRGSRHSQHGSGVAVLQKW